MKYNTLEVSLGFLITIIFASFMAYTISSGFLSIQSNKQYDLNASFYNVDGISNGSKVFLAGVEIGNVKKIELDNDKFAAFVTVGINSNVKIPKDSQIAIRSNGLLGPKVLSINPGSENECMVFNDNFIYTQSSINFESLINKMMHMFKGKA